MQISSKTAGEKDARTQSTNAIEILKEKDPDNFKIEHLMGENGLFTYVKAILKDLT